MKVSYFCVNLFNLWAKRAACRTHPLSQKSPISSVFFTCPFEMDKMDKQMDKLFCALFHSFLYLCR